MTIVVALAAALFAAIPNGPANAQDVSGTCRDEVLPSNLKVVALWKHGDAALSITMNYPRSKSSEWDNHVVQIKKSTDEWNLRIGVDDLPDGIRDFYPGMEFTINPKFKLLQLTGFEPSTSYDVRAYSKCRLTNLAVAGAPAWAWAISSGVTETLTVETLPNGWTGEIENVEISHWRGGDRADDIPLEPAFDSDVYDYTVRIHKNTLTHFAVDITPGARIIYRYGDDAPTEYPFVNQFKGHSGSYEDRFHIYRTTLKLPVNVTVTIHPDSDAEKTYTFKYRRETERVTQPPVDVTAEKTASSWLWIDWYDPATGGQPANYLVNVKPVDGGKGWTQKVITRYAIFKPSEYGLERGKTYKIWVRGQNKLGKGPKAKITFTY